MKYLEYIQNGTYVNTSSKSSDYLIDVGYIPTTATTMEIGLSTPNADGATIFSTDNGNNGWWRFFTFGSGNQYVFDCPYDSDARAQVNVGTITDYHQLKTWWDNGTAYLQCIDLNRTSTGSTSRVPNFTTSFKLWGGSNIYMGTKIYYIKLWEGQTLTMDLKPAQNNGVIGLYDAVGGQFYSNSLTGTMIAGPVLSSIVITPESKTVKSTGATITVAVSTENSWVANPADGSWYTISPTGATGDANVTITVPSYSGTTNRTDTIDFVDTNTTDEMTFTLKQKKYTSGQPVYLGGNEVTELYLGGTAITEAYLGTEQVYSSGPFVGLKVRPQTVLFDGAELSKTIKIKSSESWTMTVPAWITASTSTGDTGETVVTLTATTQTAATSGTIEVVTANYSATVECSYSLYTPMAYVHTAIMGSNLNKHLTTSIYPTLQTSGELKCQLKTNKTGQWIVGAYANDDNKDWRFFNFQSWNSLYWDMCTSRVTGPWTAMTADEPFTVTFGNNYINTATGETQTGELSYTPIQIDLSVFWISEVKLWENGVLVYDGVAAKYGGAYGLFDLVSNTFLTDPNLDIVGEV